MWALRHLRTGGACASPPCCSMFLYALVSIRPSMRYWQVGRAVLLPACSGTWWCGALRLVLLLQAALLYCEGVIIVQYAYMVPRRLDCDFLTPDLQDRRTRVAGLGWGTRPG